MKTYTFRLMTLFLSMLFVPSIVKARTEPVVVSTVETKSVESAQAEVLIARLAEIKAMDKSKMSSAEKKQLRKEVRSIKTKVNEIGGGVYLSAGAIIIIVLLLVLLL